MSTGSKTPKTTPLPAETGETDLCWQSTQKIIEALLPLDQEARIRVLAAAVIMQRIATTEACARLLKEAVQ